MSLWADLFTPFNRGTPSLNTRRVLISRLNRTQRALVPHLRRMQHAVVARMATARMDPGRHDGVGGKELDYILLTEWAEKMERTNMMSQALDYILL